MIKIGLTGGIGVGKTYVSKIFKQMGIPVFNADEQAKICMVEDVNLKDAVKLAFGENMYLKGVLQNEALAKIVFKNNTALAKLNALVHPIVKQKFEDWCNVKSTLMVIKESAILFESDSHLGLDAVICVSAPESLRIARLKERDGCSHEDIKNRMKKQMYQVQKEELADFVIINNEEKLLLPQLVNFIKEME
jgi:dephospho-CoA kinase